MDLPDSLIVFLLDEAPAPVVAALENPSEQLTAGGRQRPSSERSA